MQNTVAVLGARRAIVGLCAAVSQWLKGRRTYFNISQHLSGAGSSLAGSISRDLNSQKLHY